MIVVADIDPNHPKKITLTDVPFSMKDVCNKVPGLRWDKSVRGNTWRMPLGWANYLSLFSTFESSLRLGSSLMEWVEYETTYRISPALYWRQQEDAPGLESLYPFQRVGVQFMKTAVQALCADDMGLGKTRQAIATLMAHYQDGKDPFPCLVVAPNTTKIGWKREFEAVWPGLTVTVVSGTATQRRKQLSTGSHVVIMNWEAVKGHSRLAPYGSVALRRCRECGGDTDKVTPAACHTHIKELNHINFKSVICDEVHKMKDGASQQTRAVKYASGDAEIRIALSGTPIANSPVDLWSILNWLSPGEYPSKSQFIDRMVDESKDIHGYTTYLGIKPSMKQEFFQGLDPRMIRRTKEQVLPWLPKVTFERRDLEMKPNQKKAYIQMRDTMIAELENSDNLVVTQPMVKIGRLLQFASSYAEAEVSMVLDEKTGELKPHTEVTLIEPSNKIDAFMADLSDFGDNQLVIFAPSRQLINLLSVRMDKEGMAHGLVTGAVPEDERQQFMDRFQDGKLQWILCTTGAGGTGLTLTAANTAIYLQRPWSMIESNQADDRIYRIGSERHDKITIVDYVSSGTVDETVLEKLLKKENMSQEILRDKKNFVNFVKGNL